MLCALAILAAGFPPVELELAGGAAHTLEGNYTPYEYPFLKPALQARVAVDFLSQLSVGASFLAVIGGEAPNRVACCLYDSGNQAFSATAALASLRYRFSGTPQFWGEGGLGTGHLISLQTESAFEHAPLRGHAGFCARLAAGLRWPVGQNMLLGGELAWIRWSNVEHAESGPFGIAQSGLSTSALLFLATIAFIP